MADNKPCHDVMPALARAMVGEMQSKSVFMEISRKSLKVHEKEYHGTPLRSMYLNTSYRLLPDPAPFADCSVGYMGEMVDNRVFMFMTPADEKYKSKSIRVRLHAKYFHNLIVVSAVVNDPDIPFTTPLALAAQLLGKGVEGFSPTGTSCALYNGSPAKIYIGIRQLCADHDKCDENDKQIVERFNKYNER